MTHAARRRRLGLIWAQAEGGVIGRDGGMPWHVPEDLAHFKATTSGSPVVMGRATWDSIDPRYRPLPGRRNIVVTRRSDWSAPGAETASSPAGALELAAGADVETVWVIGGGAVFAEVIDQADVLEVTELSHPADFAVEAGDILAPEIDLERFAVTSADPPEGVHTSRGGLRYRFLRYERMPSL